MHISTKLRYALRLILALEERDGVVSTRELGKILSVSPFYLRSIALKLEKVGIIKSTRGAMGGYKLLKKPQEITVQEVAKLFNEFVLVECVDRPEVCPRSTTCKTRQLWKELKMSIESFLKNVTISDLVRK